MIYNYIRIFRRRKYKCICHHSNGRAYIVGADPSTGHDQDYQALTVWDITNAFNIELVAVFYQNDISPKVFAYIITKIATIYNKAYVAIENNGVSMATIQYLWRDFEYDNLIHLGRKSENFDWNCFKQ